MKSRIITSLLGTIFVFWAVQGFAMSFFGSSTKVYLASPIVGVLFYNGEHASNIRVVRSVSTGAGEARTDEVYTDSKGRFVLPPITENMRLSPLNELVISQKIRVFHADEDYLIWLKSKRNPEKYGELGGKPINFRCEITNPSVRVEQGRGLLQTSCEWDAIEIQGE